MYDTVKKIEALQQLVRRGRDCAKRQSDLISFCHQMIIHVGYEAFQ